MPARDTTLEEAQALGFASVDECNKHQDWLTNNAARTAAEKDYQDTPDADARRLAAAQEAGIDPTSIVWVSPPPADAA